MWQVALVWAVATCALGGPIIYLANERIRDLMRLKQAEVEHTSAERLAELTEAKELQHVELMERESAARLAAANIETHAERDRALMAQQAAEARAAAATAESESVIAARIAAEVRAIEARAEGRALAEKEAALRESAGPSRLEILMRGYVSFCDNNEGDELSFEEWLGDISLAD